MDVSDERAVGVEADVVEAVAVGAVGCGLPTDAVVVGAAVDRAVASL